MVDQTRTESAQYDASLRAEDVLDLVLQTDSASNEAPAAAEDSDAITNELKKQRLLDSYSERATSRVLFISSDPAALDPNSVAQKQLTSLTDVFNEVHIMVLVSNSKQPRTTVRLSQSAWAYPVAPKWHENELRAALEVARSQLAFTDGFRPDIIVALDPFEAAMVAEKLANAYKRPWQVHITEALAFTDPNEFITRDKKNKWRRSYLKHIFKAAPSVRVQSETVKAILLRDYPNLTDVEVLPRHFAIKELLAVPELPQTEKLFPQFSLTLLYVGDFNADSTFYRALDAARALLQSPKIALVAVGDGPLRDQFRERSEILGISRQVMFRPGQQDIVPYLQSADLCLVSDTTAEADDLVIRAAALGVPLLMARTSLRAELFQDGKDAYLCEPDNTLCFQKKLNQFVNASGLRSQFSQSVRYAVETRIEEDPHQYHLAYRDSVEQVLEHAPVEPEMTPVDTASETGSMIPAAPVADPSIRIVNGVEIRVADAS